MAFFVFEFWVENLSLDPKRAHPPFHYIHVLHPRTSKTNPTVLVLEYIGSTASKHETGALKSLRLHMTTPRCVTVIFLREMRRVAPEKGGTGGGYIFSIVPHII